MGINSVQKMPKQMRAGYTLIELVIVIVIMSAVAGSIVQVTYSTNADRSSCVLVYKGIIEQLRETAIANNCLVKVELKKSKLKVEVRTASDADVFTNDLSAILGMAPQSLSEFEVELVQICSQLSKVETKAKLEDGGTENQFVFTDAGSLEDGKDRYIWIEAERFSAPTIIKINGYTGLVELP